MKLLKRLYPDLPHGERYMFLYIIAIIEILFAFVLNSPLEIVNGLYRIVVSPSTLISDYFVIGNPGAAFMNSGLLLILGLGISRRAKKELSGPIIAAYLTLAGFSFFGKNLYNSWAVPLGVYLYSKYEKDRFANNLVFALFGTTLGPLTSLITFGLELPLPVGIFFGNLAGIVAGMMIPPLASEFSKFHQGFNMYNIGFTAGIIGMVFMGMLRGLGFDSPPQSLIGSGYNIQMGIFIITISNVMMFIGLSRCSWSLDGFRKILESPGRGVRPDSNRWIRGCTHKHGNNELNISSLRSPGRRPAKRTDNGRHLHDRRFFGIRQTSQEHCPGACRSILSNYTAYQ